MKVKILKDCLNSKVGDIINVSFPAGNHQEYIDNGFIEIIKEKEKYAEKFGRWIDENEIVIEDLDEGYLLSLAQVMVNAGYKPEYWKADKQESGHLHIKNIDFPKDFTLEQKQGYKENLMKKYIPKELWKNVDWNFVRSKRHRIAEENKEHYKGYGIKKLVKSWRKGDEKNPFEKNIKVETLKTQSVTPKYNPDDDDFVKQIKDKWKEGDRQNLTMDVSGYLRKEKRLGLSRTTAIIKKICEDCGDTDFKEREGAIKQTYQKDEKDIKGYSGLKERGVEIKEDKKNVFTNRITQAELYFNLHEYFYDKNKLWGSWDKNKFKWNKSDEVEILGNIYEKEGTDIINSKERTEIINSLKHVGRKNMPKEIMPTWIQFNKQVYDVVSGTDFEASPTFYITNPIPFDMGESEETPTIDELFVSWVGEEHKQELYEVLAFAQAPKYFIHRIICLIGSGANGKSTFLSLMRKYLGDDNVVSSSLEALMKIRFEGSKLYKKLVCLMGETTFGTLTQTDYIKGLSGEDKMRIEFKGKDSFDAVNNAKLILATNSLPATADKTDGFYRRWKIINFNNKFDIEKDVLAEIPEEEFNNLAKKCFRILQEMWIKRTFTNDGNFEDRKVNYEKHSNPLVLFLKENFEKDVNSDYLAEDFREEFMGFLSEHGFRLLSAKEVTQQLKNNGYDVKQIRKKDDNRRRILGIKKKVVSDVSDVSRVSTHLLHGKQNELPDTSDTSDTEQGKPNNSNSKKDNLMENKASEVSKSKTKPENKK